MTRRASLIIVCLLVLWLLMSGVYQPLIIGFGVVSSVLCVWIIHRLDLLQDTGMADEVSIGKLVKYLFWLTIEIGKADWAVAKVILSPEIPERQHLLHVATTQVSDFAKMVFANSITITPGTVTVETAEHHFIVHALTDDAADINGLALMDQKVSSLERNQRGRE